ncbi:MAG: helix-turn-helix domain-containing protein [Pseudomonadota bacterium]
MYNTAHSARAAASKLGVSERLVWTLIKDGELGCIKIGGRTLITDRQIDRFLTDKETLRGKARV